MTEHQPCRAGIAAAIVAEEDAEAIVSAVDGALARLQAAHDDATAAVGALDHHDAANAEAMREWSLSGTGSPPSPDPKKRAALLDKATHARAAATAAANAHAALSADRLRALTARDAARARKTPHVALAIHEAGAAALPRIERAWREMVDAYAEAMAASEMVIDMRHEASLGAPWPFVFTALQSSLAPYALRLNGSVADGEFATDRLRAHAGRLARFAAALTTDAGATLEPSA